MLTTMSMITTLQVKDKQLFNYQKFQAIVKELFIGCRKLNISLVLKVLKI